MGWCASQAQKNTMCTILTLLTHFDVPFDTQPLKLLTYY